MQHPKYLYHYTSVVNYSDLQKSELPASTTTALATMLRNSMSYTMSTGV